MQNNIEEKPLKLKVFDKFLFNFDRIMTYLENALSMTLFILMTASVVVNVVLRYVFKIPNLYGEEIARYSFILVVYMGCSICVKEGSHLGVEAFIVKFSLKVRKYIALLVDLIVTSTYALLSFLFIKFAEMGFKIFQVTPAMRIPFSWLHLTIAFCFFMCFIRSLIGLWNKYVIGISKFNEKAVEVEL